MSTKRQRVEDDKGEIVPCAEDGFVKLFCVDPTTESEKAAYAQYIVKNVKPSVNHVIVRSGNYSFDKAKPMFLGEFDGELFGSYVAKVVAGDGEGGTGAPDRETMENDTTTTGDLMNTKADKFALVGILATDVHVSKGAPVMVRAGMCYESEDERVLINYFPHFTWKYGFDIFTASAQLVDGAAEAVVLSAAVPFTTIENFLTRYPVLRGKSSSEVQEFLGKGVERRDAKTLHRGDRLVLRNGDEIEGYVKGPLSHPTIGTAFKALVNAAGGIIDESEAVVVSSASTAMDAVEGAVNAAETVVMIPIDVFDDVTKNIVSTFRETETQAYKSDPKNVGALFFARTPDGSFQVSVKLHFLYAHM